MNQTLWIVGGGIIVIGCAVMLYLVTGDGLPKSTQTPIVATSSQEKSDQSAPLTITDMHTAPASSTKTSSTKTTTLSTVVLHTTMGDITLKLYNTEAPNAVNNFVKLARSGFYDGVRFHRVIKDFMIQTGDPLSKDDGKMGVWGTGGPGYQFANEMSGHGFVRGSLGMANKGGNNSNESQFFIVTKADASFLNSGYTNFGEVIAGMDVAMRIEGVKTDGPQELGGHDRPLSPVTVTSVEVR